jgi:anti-sigma factor RsiW
MKTPAGQRCRRLRQRLSRYIDGEVTAAERRSIAAHLRHCPCCQLMAEGLRHTVKACREAGAARLPTDVNRRARARISSLLAAEPARTRRT